MYVFRDKEKAKQQKLHNALKEATSVKGGKRAALTSAPAILPPQPTRRQNRPNLCHLRARTQTHKLTVVLVSQRAQLLPLVLTRNVNVSVIWDRKSKNRSRIKRNEERPSRTSWPRQKQLSRWRRRRGEKPSRTQRERKGRSLYPTTPSMPFFGRRSKRAKPVRTWLSRRRSQKKISKSSG